MTSNNNQFLANLLQEYYKSRAIFPNVAISYFRNNDITIIVEDITNYITTKASSTALSDKITAADNWWILNQKQEESERLVQIMSLLKIFEQWFNELPQSPPAVVGSGVLILGKRFWHKSTDMIVTGASLFPSLRFIHMNTEELAAFECTADKIKETKFNDILQSDFSIGVCTLPSVHTKIKKTHKLLENDNKIGIIGAYTYGTIDSASTSTDTGNKTETDIDIATGTNSKVIIRSKIDECLDWARKKMIKVLVFPEITVDNEDCTYLKQQIIKKPGNIQLVIPGSFHRTIDNGKEIYNAAPIWLFNQSDDGKSVDFIDLGYYKKTIPFSSKERGTSNILTEDFVPGDCHRFLPVKGGVWGIAICRDVLDLIQFANPLHAYADMVDFMLMPSMNGGHTDLFTSGAEALARWHNCATFYVNADGALNPQKPESYEFVELSSAFAPYSTSPNAIYGGLYYKPKPNQKTNIPSENMLGSVRSKFIKAYKLPTNGNVQYEILTKLKNGIKKKVLFFPDSEVPEEATSILTDMDEGLNHLFIEQV